MTKLLIEWLINEQDKLDTIIAAASNKYYNEHKTDNNFNYDLKQCHIESYNLIKGLDLCYDRPNTAFSYSIWYHPRRINTFLSFFLNKILEEQQDKIEIFDLGAGTGAIQWSLGLIYVGLKRLGRIPPKITIVNIDTSPFMLFYNKEYLWKEFTNNYREIDNNFKIEYKLNSWNNENNLETSNPIIAASYLFDASDNKTEISNDFKEIVEKYNPSSLLLLTSKQAEKIKFLKDLENIFIKIGFNSFNIMESNLIFNYQLTEINNFRNLIGKTHNVSELLRPTSWRDGSYSALILQKKQIKMPFNFEASIAGSINLYNSPTIVRKEIYLNEKQQKAAKYSDNPSIIVGPAGCGKSIVITEKVKNIVEEQNYSPNLKILVTTFNKGLIGKLTEWIKDLLDSSRYTLMYDSNYKSSHFTFTNSSKTNIRVLHFDMLPKMLGGVNYNGPVDINQHFKILYEIIKKVKIEEKINNDRFDNILNPDFLFEEYNRVIYGLQVGIKNGEKTYLNITRKGRGNNPSLQKNSERRRIVWKCLSAYANIIHKEKIESFSLRKQYLLSKLKSSELKIKFDHVLVDEFQDCTEADFEIFYLMLENPNNFTIAGDLAQSIHLGTSADIPRKSMNEMSRRQYHRLDGSYRLPVRVSEAIKEISDAIVTRFGGNEAAIKITPYKSSPPGARPIVIYGETNSVITNKVLDILKYYKIYGIDKITILEKDLILQKEFTKCGIKSETDTILSLKGLEKECVLWSTQIPLEFEKEVFEFSYTILTRTSCVLIIALTKATQQIYKRILGLFNKDRLIIWDQETEIKLENFREEYKPETIKDEE